MIIYHNGNYSFSFYIIFLQKDASENLKKHEYGHTIQLRELGLLAYIEYVVSPSVKRNLKTRNGIYTWDTYYSTPWEYQADQYGEASHYYMPWAEEACERYWRLVNNLLD